MRTKNQTKLRHVFVLGIACTFLGSFAFASPSLSSINTLKGDAKKGKDIYHTCALCHTPEGWGTVDGYYPQISGQLPNVLIKQLIDIKLGNREVPTMIPFADEVFDLGHQNVADVVTYISTLPMTPKNSVGEGDDHKKGKKLYTQRCESCHGVNAEGDNEKSYPLLQGQHYEYIFRQILWIQEGLRKNGDEGMRQSIANFSDADIRAVSDYISRIKPDKSKVAETEEILLINAYEGDINKVKELLSKDVDVNAKGDNGETPLLAAVNSGKVDMTALLLSYGADIEARNFQESTPLIIAAQYGHAAITAMLIELGANLSVRDYNGYDPLMIAASRDHNLVVRQLIAFGADTTLQNNHGNTALMLAIYNEHADVVKILLEKGSKKQLSIANKEGLTPKSFAKKAHNSKISALINEFSKRSK
ncbi:Ankyrin [Nymphon striatum]|nr:Ankyrin [Nymphon striatum]